MGGYDFSGIFLRDAAIVAAVGAALLAVLVGVPAGIWWLFNHVQFV